MKVALCKLVARTIVIALLTWSTAGVTMAQSSPETELDDPDESLLEEFYLGQVGRVQHKGEVQLTFVVFSTESEESQSSSSSRSFSKSFEVEYGMTDRLELNLESSVSASVEDAEIGVTYNLMPRSPVHLIAGVDVSPRDLSDVALRAASYLSIGRGEVHGGVKYGIGDRRVVFDLDAVYGWSSLRGTLELQLDTVANDRVRVAPGVAWNAFGFQLGAGVAVPLGTGSKPSLVVKAIYEF